jgi:hypothetical protein
VIYSVVVSALVSLLMAAVGFHQGAEEVGEPAIKGLQLALFIFEAFVFFAPCFICSMVVGFMARHASVDKNA